MPINIKISDHLIMPFGFNEKWDIEKIQVVAVATDGTYLSSDTNCVHIDLGNNEPMCLSNFKLYFPDNEDSFPCVEDEDEALNFLFEYIKSNCALATLSESKFLDVYKQWIIEVSRDQDNFWSFCARNRHAHFDEETLRDSYRNMCFRALMPFPQAHIYARDPFIRSWYREFKPERMFRVDFAFWTGKNLVAVEIDGSSHIGSPGHITKDRMLARSGVQVIHILNDELEQYGTHIIDSLMPKPISRFYVDASLLLDNPLNPSIPF